MIAPLAKLRAEAATEREERLAARRARRARVWRLIRLAAFLAALWIVFRIGWHLGFESGLISRL